MSPDQIEEIKRYFGVVVEGLRSDLQQVAEGHSVIRHEIQDMRNEFRDEFKWGKKWSGAFRRRR